MGLILGFYVLLNVISVTSQNFTLEGIIFFNLFFLSNHIGMFFFVYYKDLKQLKIFTIRELTLFYKVNKDHILLTFLWSSVVSCLSFIIFILYYYIFGIEIFF